MSDVRIDQNSLSSSHEAFKNRQTISFSLHVGGTVSPPGLSVSQVVSLLRGKSIVDVYYQKRGGFLRRKSNNGIVMLDISWTHNTYLIVGYLNDTNLSIGISLDNPASPDTIADQDFDFTVEAYDAPF